jgi:hypothetical protein
MSTPTPNPAQQPNPQNTDNKPAGKPETNQHDLTQDDGDGIRGGYGNSDQTNGLEGGPDSGPDGSPAPEND